MSRKVKEFRYVLECVSTGKQDELLGVFSSLESAQGYVTSIASAKDRSLGPWREREDKTLWITTFDFNHYRVMKVPYEPKHGQATARKR